MNSKVIALVAVSIASVVGIAAFLVFQEGEAQVLSYDGPPKAVIIDQLYDEFPNEQFYERATEYFQIAGYSVDIVKTKDVTVDFYKNLPSMGYKFVVIRTHGAENEDGSNVVLFTGEKYTEKNYIQEQLFGQVKKATPLLEIAYQVNEDENSEWTIVNDTTRILKTSATFVASAENEFFAVSPTLVKDGMKGKFDDTIFILGGCNTLSNPSLAKSLVDRGASKVLGWDNKVGHVDNDYAILLSLESYFQRDNNINDAIDHVSESINTNKMAYPANFKVYPEL